MADSTVNSSSSHHHDEGSAVGSSIQPEPEAADPPRLADLLTEGWKLYEEVDSTTDPSGSTAVQNKVRLGLSKLEAANRMVSQLDLFSRNEELEEVATADLKYLLLPALQGALTMKLSGRDKRLEAVRAARHHFYCFLRRCKEYKVSKFTMPKSSTIEEEDEEAEEGSGEIITTTPSAPPRAPDLVAMASQRQAKVERYRQRKETESRIAEMRGAVENGQADDQTVRSFYLLQVRRWVTLALEEVESIDQEMDILKRMGSLSHGPPHPPHPARPPMKPFILTKDAVQARVFGAGYPSLPTMTVDDWYDQHKKKGMLPDQGVARRAGPPPGAEDGLDPEAAAAEEEKEQRAERDDREALQKARDWDDWKDSHRRGYGNRKNMG